MIRVLFVCLGNICRSPMAEAVMRHKIRGAGLEGRIEVDSAGTYAGHRGERAHSGTRSILEAHGIECAHRARSLTREDMDRFDVILTMDESNFEDVRAFGPGRARVRRLMEYAPDSGVVEVPDPYYTRGFDEVYALVDAACDGLLAALRQVLDGERELKDEKAAIDC